MTSKYTFGDEIVDSFADAGVGAVFFTSGSDILFYQEALARRKAQGQSTPKLITVPHEQVNISAAMGYVAVSGTPAVTGVHVDVGTLNFGGGLHGVSRAGLPIILTAGMPATADPGSMAGAQDGGHHNSQRVPDQNGITRQYVKWAYEVRYQDNPWNLAGRAVLTADTHPRGAVYLSIPREVSMLPSRENPATRMPYVQRGKTIVGDPPGPLVTALRQTLLEAKKPVVVVGNGGRNPNSNARLVQFIEQFGLLAMDGCVPAISYQCLPMDHPQYTQNGNLTDADVVIVLECDIPWLAGRDDPPEDAHVIIVSPRPTDELLTRVNISASDRVLSDTDRFCAALLAAYDTYDDTGKQTLKMRADAIRKTVTAERHDERRQVLGYYAKDYIDPDWAALTIADNLPSNALVLDDTVHSAPVRRYAALQGPGQYIRNPSTAGGWGPGAALGAALAQDERPVILIIGDGFYMYGGATCALWAARAHQVAFLAIVFQNNSYNTGTEETAKFYPGGYAQQGGFAGGYFPQPLDFAREAESAGAHGENVSDSDDLVTAMQRGLEQVRQGRCAVLSIQLPRLLENPRTAQ